METLSLNSGKFYEIGSGHRHFRLTQFLCIILETWGTNVTEPGEPSAL